MARRATRRFLIMGRKSSIFDPSAPTSGFETLLDRPGSSSSAGCSKSQPRRPLLGPFRDDFRFSERATMAPHQQPKRPQTKSGFGPLETGFFEGLGAPKIDPKWLPQAPQTMPEHLVSMHFWTPGGGPLGPSFRCCPKWSFWCLVVDGFAC